MIIITVPHCFRNDNPMRHCDERAEFAADELFRQLTMNGQNAWLKKSDQLRTETIDYNRARTRNLQWRRDVVKMVKHSSGLDSATIHIDMHSFTTLINPARPIHDHKYHKIAFVGIGEETKFISFIQNELRKKCPDLRDIYIDGNANRGLLDMFAEDNSVNDIIKQTSEIAPRALYIMVEVNENRKLLPDSELSAIMREFAMIIANLQKS